MEQNDTNTGLEANEVLTAELQQEEDNQDSAQELDSGEELDSEDLRKQNGILRRKLTKLEKAVKPEVNQESTTITAHDIEIINKHGVQGLEMAQKIAKRDGIKVTDVVNGLEFTNWKNTQVELQKRKESELDRSRGATQETRKTLSTPGLTSEERRQLMKEKGLL